MWEANAKLNRIQYDEGINSKEFELHVVLWGGPFFSITLLLRIKPSPNQNLFLEMTASGLHTEDKCMTSKLS